MKVVKPMSETPLTPYVRWAQHHTYLKEYYIERHIWDHEFILIDSGIMKITIGDTVYHAKKDDCIILRPYVYHKIEWGGEDCSQPHVHFDFFEQPDSADVTVSMLQTHQMTPKQHTYFRKNYFKENNLEIPYVISLKNPSLVRTLLYRIIDEFTYKMPYADVMMRGAMTALIAAVLRDHNLAKVTSYSPYFEALNELINYMMENVDEPLTLSDFAGQMKMTEWHLIQNFKSHFNTTPMKYFSRLRYNRAKNLLQYTHLSIKEVAYKLSFESPQSFSRWFKMLDGHPPITYHKKNANRP